MHLFNGIQGAFAAHLIMAASRYEILRTIVFGLYFDFKTRNEINAYYYFSLPILWLYSDFELHVYTETGRKVCGGGWVVVVVDFDQAELKQRSNPIKCYLITINKDVNNQWIWQLKGKPNFDCCQEQNF